MKSNEKEEYQISLDIDKELQLRSTSFEKCYHILVYVGNEIVPIRVDDVILAFTDNGYRFISTKESTYPVSYTLNELENMLGNMHFRINRQVIVSFLIIRRIFLNGNSKLNVELEPPFDGKTITVSKRNNIRFRVWLQNPFRKSKSKSYE